MILAQLTPPGPGALSAVCAPAAARRLGEKGDFHYPPQPGAGLNMAESEGSSLHRQGLKRRIATEERLKREGAAWEPRRNAPQATIDWRFTITAAREKLKRLYPTNSLR